MGLMASWKVGNKAMEIQCLMYLAYVRVFQGRLQEGIAFGREVLGKSRELPERAEAMGSPALSLGLLASGEYEEALEVCRRGTELARKAQDTFLLWHNLDHLGRAYEALLDLKEARRVYEETLELGAQLGPHYEALSSASLCAVAALSEDWEEAYAHARRAYEAGTSFDVLDGLYLHYEVEALLRGGDERRAREVVRRFADRPRTNGRERIAYLRSMAVLSEFEGETQRALDRLREARGASREDRAAEGTLADPEQNRLSSRAARADRRSQGGVLSSGADLENARGEYRGREAKGGLPLGTTGASRAQARLGHRAPLLKRAVRTDCNPVHWP